jgi:hypothetical protein
MPSRNLVSAFAMNGPPLIDGIIEADVWSSAAKIEFILGGTFEAALYIMNDETDLFIAFRIADATFSDDDQLSVAFDNNNDGLAFGDGDDHLVSRGDRGFIDYHWTNDPNVPILRDIDTGGTSNGAGDNSASGGFNSFELRHPLDSADNLHDFSLETGSKVGLRISYRDDGLLKGYYPQVEPSGWLEYQVSSGKTATNLSIVFAPAEVDILANPRAAVTIIATLTPNVPGKTIGLYFSKDSSLGPWVLIGSGPTDVVGRFSVTWTPPELGTYFFRADFAGDATHDAATATSSPSSLFAIPEFARSVALLSIVWVLTTLVVALRTRKGIGRLKPLPRQIC